MYRIILIIFLISSGLTAQQLPLYSQYMFDNYLINPAVSGTYDYTMVNGSIRQQWNGFDKNSVKKPIRIYYVPFAIKDINKRDDVEQPVEKGS